MMVCFCCRYPNLQKRTVCILDVVGDVVGWSVRSEYVHRARFVYSYGIALNNQKEGIEPIQRGFSEDLA